MQIFIVSNSYQITACSLEDYQLNQPASQQCSSLTENQAAVLSASQISPSEQTGIIIRFVMKYIFILYLFEVINVDNIFYAIVPNLSRFSFILNKTCLTLTKFI
jgi:hypothetical protein